MRVLFPSLVAILATGEALPFISFVEQFPKALWNILLFGVVSAIGQVSSAMI